MSRANAFAAVAATAASVLALPQQGAARDIVVHADAPASRVVVVTAAQMSSGDGLDLLDRRLHAAARKVCREQYRSESYPYLRACTSGSYRDALDQLRLLTARLSVETAASSGQLAVVVRSH